MSMYTQDAPPTPRSGGKIDALVMGADLDNASWLTPLREQLAMYSITCRTWQSFGQAPRPLTFDLLILDMKGAGQSTNYTIFKSLMVRCGQEGVAAAVVNYGLADPGPVESLLRRCDVVIADDRRALYSLLDREIRAATPGKNAGGEVKLDEMIVETAVAMARRLVEPRPSVSLVVPVHNPDPVFFKEAIASVIEQDDPDWELVLLDNGDPDITRDALAEWGDHRITYYGGLGGRGIAMGRNVGNMLARGRIIAVLDHDDVCAPDRVRAIKATLTDPDSILYSDVIQLMPGGGRELTRLKAFTEQDLLKDCNVYHPSVAYWWEFARDTPYDPRFEPADDYRMYLAALHKGRRLVHVNRPLISYRRHPVQYSQVAKARLAAVGKATRTEARYLREQGDPLDFGARYDPLILYLLGHDQDDEAMELIQLGYGLDRTRLFASVLLGDDGESTDQASIPAAMLRVLYRPEAAGDDGQWAVWLTLRRCGPTGAAGLIEAGLTGGIMRGEAGADLAELRFRQGDPEAGLEMARAAGSWAPPPALAKVHELMLGRWIDRVGKVGPDPPAAQLGMKGGARLSVIAAMDRNDGAGLAATLASLAKAGVGAMEVIVVSVEGTPETSAPPGLELTAVTVPDASLPGEMWRQGVKSARGEVLVFCRSGDQFDPGFLNAARDALEASPESDALLGGVSVGGEKLSPKAVGLSGLCRDERAYVMGLALKRGAMDRIGGFIPGLGKACGWEFLIRAMKELIVLQPGLAAGRSPRWPVIPAGATPPDYHLGDDLSLGLLVKYIHAPLRYVDLRSSGAAPEWLDKRLRELARITASPALIAHLDPWEYLAEHNTPYHLLYRLAKQTSADGLKPIARAALAEAIRQQPLEPKLWLKWLGA